MKAEEFINKWLNRNYAGAKEIEPWTGAEIVVLLKDFQKQIWDECQQVAFETEEDEETFPVEILEVGDLRKILEMEEV